MQNKTLIILNSVGSIFDYNKQTIYPLQVNGKPDYNMPTLINDINSEWYENLSKDDYIKLWFYQNDPKNKIY